MKLELIKDYLSEFNRYAYEVNGLEFWFARDLQSLLGYTKWENFIKVVNKAQLAEANVNNHISHHFAKTVRVINMPNGGTKEIDDLFLTRYACYLIAQNSDSTKEPVAFAMSYFALQTRKQELLEQRLSQLERLQARDKLSNSEKELSGLIYEQGADHRGFAIVKNQGDKALFGGHGTREMKQKLNIPKNRPLADFLPTITIKAKDFANEITVFNVKKFNSAFSIYGISSEHAKNNSDIRQLLINKGIIPEKLPSAEDVKKVKRKLDINDKLITKNAQKLIFKNNYKKY